jgi:hypothetical protein
MPVNGFLFLSPVGYHVGFAERTGSCHDRMFLFFVLGTVMACLFRCGR